MVSSRSHKQARSTICSRPRLVASCRQLAPEVTQLRWVCANGPSCFLNEIMALCKWGAWWGAVVGCFKTRQPGPLSGFGKQKKHTTHKHTHTDTHRYLAARPSLNHQHLPKLNSSGGWDGSELAAPRSLHASFTSTGRMSPAKQAPWIFTRELPRRSWEGRLHAQ